jgi:hypothetical protein
VGVEALVARQVVLRVLRVPPVPQGRLVPPARPGRLVTPRVAPCRPPRWV